MWINLSVVALCLAAFMGGLQTMRQGLEVMAKGRLPKIIQKFVRSPSRGVLTGTLSAGVMQSSAAVTAITVGLVSARNITFQNALGLVLGANVGSTLTPQLLIFNLWSLAIPALLFGIVGLFTRKPKFIAPSMTAIGFASIFIALQSLQLALHPLTKTNWFHQGLVFANHSNLSAMLVGCFASALIQSSTATTLITMTLMNEHALSLISSIAIVIGANVGTCLTSIIAAIGQSRQAKQVALSHVMLNLCGALLILPFLQPFTHWMEIASTKPDQQVANAHTFFNIACTLLVWPMTNTFAKFIMWLLPDDE